MPPGILLVAGQLRIDEAGAGFVGEARAWRLDGQAARPLLGRPAGLESREAGGAERGGAGERGALPAPRPRLSGGIAGVVALGASRIVFQLPRPGRWRASQSCRNLAERVSRGV